MLDCADADRLDLALSGLAALIDAGANPVEISQRAEGIISDFTDDGSPSAHLHGLIRQSWRETWRDAGFLASGWFFDSSLGVLDRRSGDALFAVFLTLAKLLHAASGQRRALIVEARGTIAEYLAIRAAVPQP